MSSIFIRKFKSVGIKGISEYVELDFSPNGSRDNVENIEDFDLKRIHKDFSALKQVIFLGLNAAGKSSILTAIKDFFLLLCEPSAWKEIVENDRNIFLETPIKFEVEFVMKDQVIGDVWKYIINLEYLNGKFVYENVDYQIAKTTTASEIKNLYQVKNEVLTIGGKEESKNFNNEVTFFSYIRNGLFVNKELAQEMEIHTSNFRKILIHQRIHMEKEMSDILSVNVKKNDELLKKLSSLLELFDENITGIKKDDLNGTLKFVVKQGQNKKEIPFQTVFKKGLFSTGTQLAFNLIQDMEIAYEGNSIVLLDEFGKSVHDGLFTILYEILRESKSQIFLATHNPHILETFIRNDQIFNISKNSSLKFERLDSLNIENRSLTMENVVKHLKNNPSVDKARRFIKVINEK